jgi:hypothetical protein
MKSVRQHSQTLPPPEGSQTNRKRKREQDENTMVVISQEMLCRIFSFAMGNSFIGQCRALRNNTIFDGDENWYVAWFSEDNKELLQPALMNNEKFKDHIQKFVKDASIMLDLFKFVGYYVVKDIESWYENENDRDDDDNDDGCESKLPFGVIPLYNPASVDLPTYGNYYLVSHFPDFKNEIIFKCDNGRYGKQLNNLYNFKVFNNGAQFFPIANSSTMGLSNHLSGVGSYCNSDSVYDLKILPKESDGHFGNASIHQQVMPETPYVDLYKLYSKLTEADDYQYDVAYLLSTPSLVMAVKPQVDTNVETLTQDCYYSADDMLGARQTDSIKKQQFALQTAIYQNNEMKKLSNGTDNRPGSSDAWKSDGTHIRAFKRAKYQKAGMTDGIHIMPESMEFVYSYEPKKVLDVEMLTKNFELAVCNVLKVPYQCVKPLSTISTSSSSSGGVKLNGIGNESQYSVYENMLYKEVKRQQQIFSRLFSRAYSETYSILDNMYINSVRRNEKEIERKKRQQQKKKMNEKDEESTSDSDEEEDEEDDEEYRRKNYGVSVKLVFTPQQTVTTESLNFLVDAHKAGAVTDGTILNNYIKARFGNGNTKTKVF